MSQRPSRCSPAPYVALGIHGRANKLDPATVWVGGLDRASREAIATSLDAAGFRSISQGHTFPGKETTNICNRARSGSGVQLELPKALRDRLVTDQDLLARFATAVRAPIVMSQAEFARELAIDSGAYFDAARKIASGETPFRIISQRMPLNFLLGHACELALKASLARVGYTADHLSRIGHRLDAAIAACRKEGVAVDSEFETLLRGHGPGSRGPPIPLRKARPLRGSTPAQGIRDD